MNQKFFYSGIGVIFFIGIAITLLRSHYTHVPINYNNQEKIWLVEARIDFTVPQKNAVKVDFDLPDSPLGFQLLDEQSISSGYGFNVYYANGNKRGVWTKRDVSSEQTLYYKAKFKPIAWEKRVDQEMNYAISEDQSVYFSDAQAVAAFTIISDVEKLSSDERSFTQELIKAVNLKDNQNVSMLLSTLSKEKMIQNLLSMAEINSIISYGLILEDSRRNQSLKPYIEVYSQEEGWLLFNLDKGLIYAKDNLLLWSQNSPSLLDIVGGENSHVNFSMVEQKYSAVNLANNFQTNSMFHLFSVNTLPVEEQGMFKMMLLMPIGVLIVVFMRIFVGVKTSGTFMPVLIALAFLQTSFMIGLIGFVSIVVLGLLIRSYLSFLNLLMVARISAIIIIVIFIIGLLSIIGYNLGFNTGMTVTFFPIIIIAWTIERMSIIWEEEGAKEVLIQGSGSLLVASLTYLVMNIEFLGHITFNFPEINISIIAFIILLGRYSGYKVLELYRFRHWE